MSVSRIPYTGEQKRKNEELLNDFRFFRENRHELLAQYPDQWIAIKWQQVVAAASDYFEMVGQLEIKGIAYSQTIREYMTENEEILVPSNWNLDDD
jgi:hypothetical protein